MRNYWGEIINGEVGDLVTGRCNSEKVARVVEIAKDGYGITIEETSYKLADDGFTVIGEDTLSRLGKLPQVHHKHRFNPFFERARGERIIGGNVLGQLRYANKKAPRPKCQGSFLHDG
jgi:hypothetical protein